MKETTNERTVTADAEERAAVVAWLRAGNPCAGREPSFLMRLRYAWAAVKAPMALMAASLIVASEYIERGEHLRGGE